MPSTLSPPSATIAIIAGNGQLPFETADNLLKRGLSVHIVGIIGEVEEAIHRYPHSLVEWGQIGKLFRVLKEHSVKDVLLLGGVDKRPEITIRKMDWGGLRTLPQILAIALGGDNTVLTGVIEIFEKRGFKVRSMIELAPELLVAPGANTSRKIRTEDKKRLEHGADVVSALGKFDIGQGAIVVGDRAVAVEGAEGTDAMLARVAELRASGRLPEKRGGVLIKRVKPGQDERADLPTIGPATVENVHLAGLNGIGVEAGRTLIAERERTFELAAKHGIFIYGLKLPKGDA